MTKLSPLFLMTLCVSVISCAHYDGKARLTNEHAKDMPRAEDLYNKGLKQEQQGDLDDAAKIYDLLAERYPSYAKAEGASFQAAQFWEREGEPKKAFDSYQRYIETFRNGRQYKHALKRQSEIAFAAATGGLTTTFLGMKSEPDRKEVVEMLGKVRDNAPASSLAARAQFQIGSYLESKEKVTEAVEEYLKVVDGYPSHSLAPEAHLRAAKALAGFSQDGNNNSNRLNKARLTFKDLIQQYPSSSQAKEARKYISDVDGLNVQRTFGVAEFYESKGQTKAAKFYYYEVMEKAQKGSHYYNLAKERHSAL